MIVGSIARRYAKALLQIGVAQKSYDDFAKELERIRELVEESRELGHVLSNPIFPLSERHQVLAEVARRLALSKIMRSFLALLLDRGRIGALDGIAREYRTLCDRQAGRLRARVSSARPLDPGTELRLKSVLERRSGKTVILEKRADPALIGGLVTQVGDMVYDGSVRTQLERVREQLLAE